MDKRNTQKESGFVDLRSKECVIFVKNDSFRYIFEDFSTSFNFHDLLFRPRNATYAYIVSWKLQSDTIKIAGEPDKNDTKSSILHTYIILENS